MFGELPQHIFMLFINFYNITITAIDIYADRMMCSSKNNKFININNKWFILKLFDLILSLIN